MFNPSPVRYVANPGSPDRNEKYRKRIYTRRRLRPRKIPITGYSRGGKGNSLLFSALLAFLRPFFTIDRSPRLFFESNHSRNNRKRRIGQDRVAFLPPPLHPSLEAAACPPCPRPNPSPPPNIDLSDITTSCRWKMLSTVRIRNDTYLKSYGNPEGGGTGSIESEQGVRRVDLRVLSPPFLLFRFKIIRVKKKKEKKKTKGRKRKNGKNAYKLYAA